MKLITAALIALMFAPAQDQEGTRGGENASDEIPTGTLRVRTDMERLYTYYGARHGGRAKLDALKTVSFRWIPHEVGETGPARELEPLLVTLQLSTEGERFVRFDEEIEGQTRIKIVNDLQNVARVWIDGEERRIPEMITEAQQEAKLLFMLLDLIYRPESPDLKGNFEGLKERDGKEWVVAHFEFHDSRMLEETYRLFYDADDGLVGRIDVHDKRTAENRRISTLRFSEYHHYGDENPVEAIKFPSRAEWTQRGSEKVIALWRFVDVELNPVLPPGYFAGP